MLIDPLNFPVNRFPPRVSDAIFEVHSNNKAPHPLVATSALMSMSLACQHNALVELPNGKRSPAALFALCAVESGSGKSACDKAFFAPFYEADIRYREQNEIALAEFQALDDAWAARYSVLLRKLKKASAKDEDTADLAQRLVALRAEKPNLPILRRFIFSNSTPQALLLGLHQYGGSVGLISDEAGKQMFGPTFSDSSNLSQIWDGASIFVDRIASDSFALNDPSLTMYLQTQPPEFERYRRTRGQQAFDSGFFNRFLFCFPISNQGYRFIDAYSSSSHQELEKFHARIRELIAISESVRAPGEGKRHIRFSSAAADMWREMFNRSEGSQQQGAYLQFVRGAASKITDNSARIAAIIHIFEDLDGDISAETFLRAIDISRWYIEHFWQLFGQPAPPECQTDGEALAAWLSAQHHLRSTDGFVYIKKSKLRQFCPNGLRKEGRVDAALNYLAAAMRAQIVTVKNSQYVKYREVPFYEINPLI